MAVTFRLSVEQFQLLLTVLMADDVPDHLSNAVLMACTRPHAGIISVPLPLADGSNLADVVDRAASVDRAYTDLAALIRTQFRTTSVHTVTE